MTPEQVKVYINDTDMTAALVSAIYDIFADELSKLTHQDADVIKSRIKTRADEYYADLKSKRSGD
jgi:hypothetical protein